jgi:asparagine synthase (glutamine-hydrolysing)
MFAFAIWDSRRELLMLARDRVGIKPLYYNQGAGGLAFASEAKALLIPELVPLGLRPDTTIDAEALDVYLSLRYVPGTRTLWRGVQKLAAGHVAIYRNGALRDHAYWDVPLDEWGGAQGSTAQLTDELRDRVDDAVKTRLMSEVPLGAFLSGGLDSSTVVASMARQVGAGLHTFSIGYEGPGDTQDSELPFARLMAEKAGTLHREVVLDAQDLAELLPAVALALDEPLADPAAIPLYRLAQRAKDEVTVILSGEGADEVLAGYGAYSRELWVERMRALAHLPPGLGWATDRALQGVRSHTQDPRLRRALLSASLPLEARYSGISRALDPDERSLLGLGDALRVRHWLAPYFERTRHLPPLARMLYLDMKTWLPDDLLLKADKVTMASALELRVPLLDHILLELCWRLPQRLKLRGGVGKWLLRQAVAERLPQPILTRPKKGFPVPLEGWLRGPLHGLARDLLIATDGLVSSIFPRPALRRLLDEHRAGRRHEDAIFSLMMLELWHRPQRDLLAGNHPKAAWRGGQVRGA